MEIDEANRATFGIVADRAPTSPFVVDLIVERTGDFYGGSLVLMRATIPANSMSVPYSVLTLGDLKDEVDGTITVTIDDSGLRYLAWSGRESAVVKVKDDDDAPAPEKVRVNGHLTTTTTDPITKVESGPVIIRWNKVEDATAYRLQWGRVTCPSTCSLSGGWNQVPTLAYSESGNVVTASLNLDIGQLYSIEIKVTVVDESDWSKTVAVWPQKATPAIMTPIGGIQMMAYQTDGHYRDYRICNPPLGSTDPDDPYPIPSTVDAADIRAAVNTWLRAVLWNTGGKNIIRASGGDVNAVCDSNSNDPAHNQVAFYHPDTVIAKCNRPDAIACWTEAFTTTSSMPEGILLKYTDPWTTTVTLPGTTPAVTCGHLQSVVAHEVGHAFGLYHTAAAKTLMHANFRACYPDQYEVAAMMANYQSR